MKPTMKGHMKHMTQLILGCLALAALIIVSGCASASQPNYQGHKGASPTIYDYYPSKAKP
jgi:hypothetical protein